ncbi:SET domain-containing protein [Prunus dulcis]|uniref:SET domain-containing protein n=1 Tax=Prunus dulcis TaxID=3755 RepID=A0A4Y1R1B0_PRUDU|nr:SET domain-containing protein [Prunus dulcis]
MNKAAMEMEMEMEMRAEEDIEIGEDITPPLTPLAFALHDSLLSSHCSSCFSLLPPHPFPPLHFTPTFPHNPHHVLSSSSYCSPLCSTSDSPLHVSSAELHLLHLLQSHPSTYPHGDSSDLRAALRLLHSLPAMGPSARIVGLLTNHHKFLHHDDHHRIRDGARAMFLARKMRDEAPNVCSDNSSSVSPDDAVLEEAALCLVLTNAVEVQDKTGRTLGISVYGPSFCWINHSCSPNACYRFLVSPPPPPPCSAEKTPLRIAPWAKEHKSIKRIKKGEEVTVTYTDLLQPKKFPDPTGIDINFNRDKATQRLTNYIDDAIDDYLSIGDPESSSVRLEHVLPKGKILFDLVALKWLLSVGLGEEYLEVKQRDTTTSLLAFLPKESATNLKVTYLLRAHG